jgi:hypothetical protein
MITTRTMPLGECSGCGEVTHLPPFAEGMCFLCATDGPPGDTSPTGGALAEDADARRESSSDVSDQELERIIEILDEFDNHQEQWARAIARDHYRSQRFATWSKSHRLARLVIVPLEEMVRLETASAIGPNVPTVTTPAAKLVYETHERRNGSGNFTDPSKIAQATVLRAHGLSLRAIAKETGLHKETVRRYVSRVDRSEAMRLMHARLKNEGRPNLPPWRRAKGTHIKKVDA